jgi:hypothetical protein
MLTALIVALVCAVLYILWLFKVIVDDGKTIDFMNKVNADVIKLNEQLKDNATFWANRNLKAIGHTLDQLEVMLKQDGIQAGHTVLGIVHSTCIEHCYVEAAGHIEQAMTCIHQQLHRGYNG